MKQGKAPTVQSGHHVEPKSKAINPEYVAQMGNAQGHHVMEKGDIPFRTVSMYGGHGLAAPECKTTFHTKGSQGRH